MKERAFILIFDMLAGHWEEGITVPSTQLPPPNVMGYSKNGNLPAFGESIEHGIFAYAWNRGNCCTSYGQKYLASGTYDVQVEAAIPPYVRLTRGMEHETILGACKKKYPWGKVAAFGSDAWMQSGWWKASDATYGWGSYFSDLLTAQASFNWMMSNPDWKMVLLYLAQYDLTGNCPVYGEDAARWKDKHHSIVYIDKILWLIMDFLKENGWWDETFLFISSDHGCHYGCEVAVDEGRKRSIPENELANYCSNHQAPYECRQWDFGKNAASWKMINCTQRITFIVTGGVLDQALRNKIVPYAEIIDFAPTVAQFMNIQFSASGKPVAI